MRQLNLVSLSSERQFSPQALLARHRKAVIRRKELPEKERQIAQQRLICADAPIVGMGDGVSGRNGSSSINVIAQPKERRDPSAARVKAYSDLSFAPGTTVCLLDQGKILETHGIRTRLSLKLLDNLLSGVLWVPYCTLDNMES